MLIFRLFRELWLSRMPRFQMDDPEGEGIRQLEDHLKMELLELRNEIEENDLVHGIPSKGMR